MDEPCSALDPISTLAIEELMSELKTNYTIIIVTHNMQQAKRVSAISPASSTSTVSASPVTSSSSPRRTVIFNDPNDEATKRYVSGNFG